MTTVYQITARRTGMPLQTITVGSKPLHFGSGEKADLRLDDANIPPIAGRLFIGSGNQIILFNLGSLGIRFTLDGVQVPSLEHTMWKPGAQLQVNTYTIDLKTIDMPLPTGATDETPIESSPLASDGQSTRPPLISPAPAAVLASASASPAPNILPETPTNAGYPLPSAPKPQQPLIWVDDNKDTVKGREGFIALDSNQINVTEPLETGVKQWKGNSESLQTQTLSPPIVPDSSEDQEGFTRFKNWMEQDKLSVQLGLKTINFAPGERIMIPLSVHNNYSHSLELLASVSGLPQDWKMIDAPLIALDAGEWKAFELVIMTRAAAGTPPLDAHLLLADRVTPQIKATIPLPITLKTQPDLIGYFETSRIHVPGSVYLTLQNQTLSPQKVRLSIGPHHRALRVLLPNPEIELAPYQKVRVPIRVDVVDFPRLISRNCAFHISAQQGTRAPIDLSTVVSVQPSLLRYFLLITIGLLGALLLLIIRTNSTAFLVASSTATFTPTTLPPTFTAMPAATVTEMPTAIPMVIPPIEVIIPTNTPLPFVDPRSPECQASIPVPNGWVIYVVKSGENLYRIALNHHINTVELARVNCIKNITIIHLGDQLLVPAA